MDFTTVDNDAKKRPLQLNEPQSKRRRVDDAPFGRLGNADVLDRIVQHVANIDSRSPWLGPPD